MAHHKPMGRLGRQMKSCIIQREAAFGNSKGKVVEQTGRAGADKIDPALCDFHHSNEKLFAFLRGNKHPVQMRVYGKKGSYSYA